VNGHAFGSDDVLLCEDAATGVRLRVTGRVAWLHYDQPGSPVNTLNSRVGPVFAQCFDRIEQNDAIDGAVLVSDKADTWIAGADIDELRGIREAAAAEALSRGGQQLLNRLATFRKPIVAAIHGAALGGGLEVALACRHRMATEHEKTVLALPEVQLGLLPGAGGTQRLPRVVGLQAALDMMLTGRNIRARKAWQMGLVHELVHPAILRQLAAQRVQELAAGVPLSLPLSRRRRKTPPMQRLLEDNPMGRALVYRKARESVLKKTGGHYPAPLALLDVVKRGLEDGMAAGLVEEARAFGRLAVTPESRHLVSIFFATTALKKDSGLRQGQTGKTRPVRKLAVLGAGFMGAGIAGVAVQRGSLVRLKDASLERVAAGMRAVRDVVSERQRRRQITRREMDDMLSALSPTVDYRGFADVDLVIEAVFEDLAVKHAVLREVEDVAPQAIFASNTSTIPLRDIAAGSRRPSRVIGMHFFSPVHKMPLLEVIVAPQTDGDTVATAVAYGKQLGKTVIVVNDGAGFYVNRMLAPYLNEAGRLIDEGARVEDVDRALTAFGFPVGPITLLDEVGLDIAGKSGPILAAVFGPRMKPSATLSAVLASGRLGRKARRGFYRYDDTGKREAVDNALYALTPNGPARKAVDMTVVQQRTVLPLLNEAVRCLEEGVIRSPRDGDIGAVFGIGFPPFRGGPFRYIDQLGAANIVAQLEALDTLHPGRYTPASQLRDMAERGGRFHP
jgi:3-hydroxyacyl-CoA dehydrogenase/enoyl-CoA hydratase/3-hydroxybutyryl-CoA epimerase